MIGETMHTAGVIVFSTLLLTQLDMFHAACMFLSLGVVPSLVRLVSHLYDLIRSWFVTTLEPDLIVAV